MRRFNNKIIAHSQWRGWLPRTLIVLLFASLPLSTSLLIGCERDDGADEEVDDDFDELDEEQFEAEFDEFAAAFEEEEGGEFVELSADDFEAALEQGEQAEGEEELSPEEQFLRNYMETLEEVEEELQTATLFDEEELAAIEKSLGKYFDDLDLDDEGALEADLDELIAAAQQAIEEMDPDELDALVAEVTANFDAERLQAIAAEMGIEFDGEVELPEGEEDPD